MKHEADMTSEEAMNYAIDRIKMAIDDLDRETVFAVYVRMFGQDGITTQMMQESHEGNHILGDTTKVVFTNLGGGATVDAKVDSGATTSSLHVDKIDVHGNQVSFVSSALGGRRFTMDLVGNQQVHSADGGVSNRPVIKCDIEVNGKPLQGIMFNLNDRSNMDTPVLCGQNVLKAGDFVIDVQKGQTESVPENAIIKKEIDDKAIVEAIETLANSGMTLAELFTHMRTVVVRNLKDE